ncbi:hypothetical protein L6R50_09190 [Myxococcota bacterium]|nr:hypothetical protein [Myxococcota bacterium]
MNIAVVPLAPDRSVRVDLTLPITRMGIGAFSFDPVRALVGAPVADLLAPLLRAPVGRRPSASGVAVEVYPLALPEGEGMSIPLGHLGEVAFRNDAGTLVLSVPVPMAGWAARQLGDAVTAGPVRREALSGSAAVADFWVRLRPGSRKSLPLGTLGELGVEAAE